MFIQRNAIRWVFVVATVAVGWTLPNSSMDHNVSDHWDSPTVRNLEQSADLTDLYAVPLGNNRLLLVMNLHPYASAPTIQNVGGDLKVSTIPVNFEGLEAGFVKLPGTQFSNAIEYAFRIRQAKIAGKNETTNVDILDDELSIVFKFDDGINQSFRCVAQSPKREVTIRGKVDITKGTTDENQLLKCFAGCRADTFFANPGRIIYDDIKPNTSGRFNVLKRPADSNEGVEENWGQEFLPVSNANVISIVLEVQLDQFLDVHQVPVVAVVAETRKNGSRIDRLGRPVTSNFLLSKHIAFPLLSNTMQNVRDQWNRMDPFEKISFENDKHLAIKLAIEEGLDLFDSADSPAEEPNQRDWNGVEKTAILSLLSNDYLLTDVSCTVSPDSSTPDGTKVNTSGFFGIELAKLRGDSGKFPGGRAPNEDAIDIINSVLINGSSEQKPRRDDGDKARSPAEDAKVTSTFPYLRPGRDYLKK